MAVNKNPNPNYNPIYLDEGDIITNDYVDQVQDQLKQIVDNIPDIVQIGGADIPTNGYNQMWIKENTNVDNNGIQVPQLNEFNALKNSVAQEYKSNQKYEIGDYVTYQNKIYRCIKKVVTSGAWNSSYWTQASLGEDLSNYATNVIQEKYEVGLNVLSNLRYQPGYINDVGNIADKNSTYKYITYDPIKVESGQKFIINLKTRGAAWLGITFWDEEYVNFLAPRITYSDNSSKIQGSYHIIQKKIEVPIDAKYVRISVRTNGNYSATLNRIDSIVTSYNRLHVLANDYEKKPYKIGDYAFYEDQLYKCIVKIDAGQLWTATHWQATNLQKQQDLLKDTVDSRFWNIIAPQYSKNKTYDVNDYVIYDNCLYQCNSKITNKGDFISTKWTQVIIGDEINDFEKNIILAQDNQPNLKHNRLWIPTKEQIEVQVPTYDEFNQLSKELESINNDVYYKTEKAINTTASGWRLNESDGLSRSNSGYKLVKYKVAEGDTIKILSDDRFQFQTVATVPSSGEPNRVGNTYGAGTFTLTVPENAAYLIISTPTESNAIVFDLVACKQKIAEIGNALYAEDRFENRLAYDAYGHFSEGKYDIQVGYGIISASIDAPATSLYLELKNPLNKISGSSSATKYISLKGGHTYKLRTILLSGSFEGQDSYMQCMISSGKTSSDYVQTIRGGSKTFSYASDTDVSLIFYIRYQTIGNVVFQYCLEDVTEELSTDSIKDKFKLVSFMQDATQYTKGNTSGSWYDRPVFLHIADNHVGTAFSDKNLNELVNVANSLHVNAVINSGDMTIAGTISTTKATVLSLFDTSASLVNGFDAEIPVLETLGNHDSNDVAEINLDYISTKKEQWDHIFAPIAEKYDSIVWGDSEHYKHYHYCDVTVGDYTIRIITLDGLDHDDYSSGDLTYNCFHWEVFSQGQINWLCNTALNVPSGNYGIIINNHFPFAPRRIAGYSEQWPALNDAYFAQGWKMIPEIIRAWTNRETLSKTYADSKLNMNNIMVNANFSNVPSGAVFVCYTVGHTHSKNAFIVKEENGENFNQLMLCEDSSGRQGSALNRVYKYDNGVENTAASQIAIDMVERKVYRTAYGAYQHCSNEPMARTEIFDF